MFWIEAVGERELRQYYVLTLISAAHFYFLYEWKLYYIAGINTKQMHCHKFSIHITNATRCQCMLSFGLCIDGVDEVASYAKCKHKMLDKFPVNVWPPFFSILKSTDREATHTHTHTDRNKLHSHNLVAHMDNFDSHFSQGELKG